MSDERLRIPEGILELKRETGEKKKDVDKRLRRRRPIRLKKENI